MAVPAKKLKYTTILKPTSADQSDDAKQEKVVNRKYPDNYQVGRILSMEQSYQDQLNQARLQSRRSQKQTPKTNTDLSGFKTPTADNYLPEEEEWAAGDQTDKPTEQNPNQPTQEPSPQPSDQEQPAEYQYPTSPPPETTGLQPSKEEDPTQPAEQDQPASPQGSTFQPGGGPAQLPGQQPEKKQEEKQPDQLEPQDQLGVASQLFKQKKDQQNKKNKQGLKEIAAKVTNEISQQGTKQVLKWSWGSLIDTFGATIIYIWIHGIAKYWLKSKKFCAYAEEWAPKGKASKLFDSFGEKAEQIVVIVLTLIILAIIALILVILISAAYAIMHPIETVREVGLEPVWSLITGGTIE